MIHVIARIGIQNRCEHRKNTNGHVVLDMTGHTNDQVPARTGVDIAHNPALVVVAEGVEDAAVGASRNH